MTDLLTSPVDLEQLVAASPPECLDHAAVQLAAAGDLPIAAVAKATGVTAHTLRYYERIGLVSVPRDGAGHRRYGPHQVGRIVFIHLLRASAMPICDLREYFGLVADGPGNEAERVAVLTRHRAELISGQERLRTALSILDFKLARYRGHDHTTRRADQEQP